MSNSIRVEKVKKSRLPEVDLENIEFGRIFSDHMLEAEYRGGKWQPARIVPFGNFSLSPATTALHYGQEIFEGLKAYKNKDGKPVLFRPKDNWQRMNRSAKRMCMPGIPEEIFMDGLKKLLSLDQDWIPTTEGSSLYIRPFMIATDEYVGIKPADNYKFMTFTCPVGPYYPEPIKVYIEEKYSRAAPGGVGSAKAAGNYAASLYPARLAQEKGYRQLVWTDAKEHRYIEESGTMNIFFVINGKVVTPELEGTILKGITRDSVLTLLKDEGYPVEERKITVSEICQAYEDGTLEDVFGTGTAATLAHIKAIGYRDRDMELPPVSERKISSKVLKRLYDIKLGSELNKFNWIIHV